MTEEMMQLQDWLQKSTDADVSRENLVRPLKQA